MKKWQQQGDVIIKPVEKLPAGCKNLPSKNGLFVLAEGEVTGHKHAIEEIAGVEFFEKNGMFYLANKVPVTLRHEEHHAQVIEPGTWEIGKVREYDHFSEEARNVAD